MKKLKLKKEAISLLNKENMTEMEGGKQTGYGTGTLPRPECITQYTVKCISTACPNPTHPSVNASCSTTI